MAGTVFSLKTEEQKVGWVTLFTSIVMVMTIWMTVAEVDKSLVRVMIALYVIVFVAIVAAGIYERRAKKVATDPQDERSALRSLKATRNAFLFALMLMAVYMIMGQRGAPLAKIMAIQTIFGISMAVYSMSYLYYKRVD
jgi:Ca2+/Na+ antiporter